MVRCLTPLIILALLVAIGLAAYNYSQISLMRKELGSISSRVHRSPAAGPGRQIDLLTSLASARSHLLRAREAVTKSKTAAARAELDRSLRSLDRASALSQDIAADAGHGLGAAWSKVRKEIADAWNELSKQLGNAKAGHRNND